MCLSGLPKGQLRTDDGNQGDVSQPGNEGSLNTPTFLLRSVRQEHAKNRGIPGHGLARVYFHCPRLPMMTTRPFRANTPRSFPRFTLANNSIITSKPWP